MDKGKEFKLFDWNRIFIGDNSWEFLLEVFLRTVFIYLLLMIIVRLLGKRMTAQMGIAEMAIMVTLGGIISVPMQLADRGVLPGIVVLLCALLFHKGFNWLNFKYKKIEKIAHGEVSLLIADGCLQLDVMRKAKTSREQIFAQLRCKNVQHLGQVKRLYQEANGYFSLYKNHEPIPGLGILPQRDQYILQGQPKANGHFACSNCGKTEQADENSLGNCKRCGEKKWTPALNVLPEMVNA
jgi:uncharacterized membrane protein YcaP (DUF421 family)